MNEKQQKYLEKARQSLEAAKHIQSLNYPEIAVSRAYYTMFYVASAFLEGENLSYSKHSAVISAFGQYFARLEKVPRNFHRYLIKAEEMRKIADYGLDSNINLDDAGVLIQQAEEMLDFALNNLG